MLQLLATDKILTPVIENDNLIQIVCIKLQ